jgi:pyroglutamyl-peptidase
MTRVLMTSFEPFGGHALNSSHEVGRALAQNPPAGIELHWLALPVVAPTCVEQAWAPIAARRPTVVLALGQAAGATVVRLEDRAVNLDDFPIPDNAGHEPKKQPILPGGPSFYRTTAPLVRLFEALNEAGIPHEHSFSAGNYVCNHLYFGLLHRAETAALTHQTLFVHLPLLPHQVPADQKWPSQPLDVLVAAVCHVIHTLTQ